MKYPVYIYWATLAQWALASALPKHVSEALLTIREVSIKGRAVQPSDKFWQQLDDSFKRETCQDPAVTDANKDSKSRWNDLGADRAWEVANSNYMEAAMGNTLNIGYTQYLSNYFNGPEGWDCVKIADQSCAVTVQCDDVNHPAGYFVLNAVATLHGVLQGIYNAIDHARGDLEHGMNSFVQTFSPKAPQDLPLEIFKTILDTALFVGQIGSAWTFNKFVKPNAKTGFTGDDRGFAKDTFNAAMAYSINMSKDNKKSPKNQAEAALKLEDVANVYYQQMSDIILEFNKHIFSGRADTISQLGFAMQNGALMPNNDLGIDEGPFKDSINGLIYAKLLPQAWTQNPERHNIPLVWETEDSCDGSDRRTTKDLFADDVAAKTRVCIDNVAYYVLNGLAGELDSCIECLNTEDKPSYEPLPGGTHDELDGTRWGGITLEDMVKSIKGGFDANGGKNGYEQPTDIPEGDPSEYFDNLSLSNPGFWTGIPYCTKDMNPTDNIMRYNNGDFYPCF